MKKTMTKVLCMAFALFASQHAMAQTEVLLEEPFNGSLGCFTVEGYNGPDDTNAIWFGENNYIVADAYQKIGPKEHLETYLVSPEIALGTNGIVTFEYMHINFAESFPNSTFFVVREVGGEWQTLDFQRINEAMLGQSGDISIPASFNGKNIQVAFKYTSQGSNSSGTWNLKNFKLKGDAAVQKVDPAISYDVTDVYYILDSDFAEPVLNNPNNVAVNYSSSDKTIATVDAVTGEVKAIAEGNVTITATAPETDNYLAGVASYNITVTAPAVKEAIFSETFESGLGEFTVEGSNGANNDIWKHDIAFVTADALDKITEPLENYLVSPVITLTDTKCVAHFAQYQDYFTMFAKETSFVIRTVDGEWQKLPLAGIPTKGNWSETGDIKIPAEFSGKQVQFGFRYSAQGKDNAGIWSISDFVVEKVCNGTDPKLSFEVDNAIAFVGQEFTAPVLNNPYEVVVTYASSNPEVAEVNATTGEVVVLKQGTTTISATSVATETFVSRTATYNITVNAPSAEDIVFEAYFDDSFCGFKVEGFNGGEMPIWKLKDGTVRADAFTKVSEPSTNYLVSPTIKLSESGNTAEFNYKYLHDTNSKTAAEEEFGFVIRELDGEWEELVMPNVDASNTMVNSGVISIPEKYSGKKVQVAFKYFAESGNTSGVFSIDDIVIKKIIATSIEGVNAEEYENAVVYDLQGRRVDQFGKGVYIVNGKKLVIK